MSLYSLEPVARYLNNLKSNEAYSPQNYQASSVQMSQQNPQQQENYNFFTNPKSDYDVKRAQLQEEYRMDVQRTMKERDKITRRGRVAENQDSYVPSNNNREQRAYPIAQDSSYIGNSRFNYQDSGFQPNGYVNTAVYQAENDPNRQISETKTKKTEKTQESFEEYFPFGRPGAGAPVRDSQGHIVTRRAAGFTNNMNTESKRNFSTEPTFIPQDSSQKDKLKDD